MFALKVAVVNVEFCAKQMEKKRRIAIIGCTGSIGTQALEVIRELCAVGRLSS